MMGFYLGGDMSFLDYFKKNYMQNFEISESDKILMDLAKEYHECCDLYDDRICSGKNQYGESTPRTSAEFQLINTNAQQVRKRVILKGASLGFSREAVSKAISKYQ